MCADWVKGFPRRQEVEASQFKKPRWAASLSAGIAAESISPAAPPM